MKKHEYVIGKENGNSKVAQGDEVVEFTTKPDTESIENRFDELKEEPAKPILDPKNILGFDIDRMLGVYDAYVDMAKYLSSREHRDIDAKALSITADRFLASGYEKTINMLDATIQQTKEMNPAFSNIPADSTAHGQNMPETVRKIIVNNLEHTFKSINQNLKQYVPTNTETSQFQEIVEQTNEMYKELNETNKLSGVMILASMIDINFHKIRNALTKSDYSKNSDTYLGNVKKISNMARDTAVINYAHDIEFDYIYQIKD